MTTVSIPSSPRKAEEPYQPQPQESEVATKVMIRYQQLCLWRDAWKVIFTLLSKYILMRPAWFGDIGVPWRTPRLSVANVADDKVVDAANTSANALLGALWPNIAESFEFVPHDPYGDLEDNPNFNSDEEKAYCARATKIARHFIDQPEAGSLIALGEYINDQVVYGTSGVVGNEDVANDDVPVTFKSVGIETSVIDEGVDGRVDTLYLEHAYTARQVVEIYGLENVSDKVRGLYESRKYDDFVKVVQALEPRKDGKPGQTVEKLPYASIHVEYDSRHVLKNSGINEKNFFVTRFRKRPVERYGRSLCMDALPSVKELNVLRKGYSMALQRMVDPPLGFYHEQLGGGGQIDISPGARVPLYATGRLPQGQKPVEQLLTIVEPQGAVPRLQDLTALIDIKLLLDKLLDFNNKTRMTLGETEKREDLKDQALSNIFSRQIVECLHPMVKWSAHVFLRRGLLGLDPVKDIERIQRERAQGLNPLVIPKSMLPLIKRGKLPFGIRFISPAARAMNKAALFGLEKLTNYTMAWANAGHQEAFDAQNVVRSIRAYQPLVGAPIGVMNSAKEENDAKKARIAAQQQQMELQSGEAKATIADRTGSAAKKFSQAGFPGMGLPQQQPMGQQGAAA